MRSISILPVVNMMMRLFLSAGNWQCRTFLRKRNRLSAAEKPTCAFCVQPGGGEKEWTLSEILDQLLHGREKGQLAAAAKLTERNLRNCTAELQTYLSRDPLPEAASLIIDSLAEQEVNEEFVYRKNGVEYTFWADAVTPVSASTGFRKALRIMENHYLQYLHCHH